MTMRIIFRKPFLGWFPRIPLGARRQPDRARPGKLVGIAHRHKRRGWRRRGISPLAGPLLYLRGYGIIPVMSTGLEWLIDAEGCDSGRLCNITVLRALCDEIISTLALRVVGSPVWHQFPDAARSRRRPAASLGCTCSVNRTWPATRSPRMSRGDIQSVLLPSHPALELGGRAGRSPGSNASLCPQHRPGAVAGDAGVRGQPRRGRGWPMKGIQAACPACAAPVRFKISSSLVTVCEFCHSVVARGDKQLEDLGKISDLAETDSPLHLGLRGKYQGKSFEIVGRTQYRHAAGGVWDEWYAAFPNNRWGWLAEAQGRFYLTFARKIPDESALPALDELHAGETVAYQKHTLSVAEVGRATVAAAAGEIPWRLEPGSAHDYADVYGPNGVFATFDYSSKAPRLYLGKESTLDDLGIGPDVLGPEKAPRQISALQVNCPNCGGALTLHVPDQAQRVSCPHCVSLLDCHEGKLTYLTTLNFGKVKPDIPLGTEGTFRGIAYTVIGFMRRSVTEGGQDYFWSEYLLYNPRQGFRWLVQSDGHWSFAEPVSPGEVQCASASATVQGRSFKIFQTGEASVRYVLGEFYWKVFVGERVRTTDFIAPPEMLSVETTLSSSAPPENDFLAAAADAASELLKPHAEEVQYSLATYVPCAEIEQAFGVQGLRRGWKVAPNQPCPVDRRIYGHWLLFGLALGVMDVVFSSRILKHEVSQFWFCLSLAGVSIMPLAALLYSSSFEKSRWQDSEFSPYGGSDSESGGSWLSASSSDDD